MRAAIASALRHLAQRLDPCGGTRSIAFMANDEVTRVYIDGEEIIEAIRRRNRHKGLPPESLGG